MTPEDLTDLVVACIEDAKGRDVSVNDVRGMTDITDWMVIASGTSDRHTQAVAQRVQDGVRDKGRKPSGVEGADDSQWIILDYGDVVVHVMQQKTREFYDLDGLWNENIRELLELPRDNTGK